MIGFLGQVDAIDSILELEKLRNRILGNFEDTLQPKTGTLYSKYGGTFFSEACEPTSGFKDYEYLRRLYYSSLIMDM